MRRVFVLARKEFIQLTRDRRLLPAVLVIPLVQLILFGYVALTEIKNAPMLLVDHDKTAESRALSRSFTNAGYFTIVGSTDDEGSVPGVIDTGVAQVALIIPAGYQQDLEGGRTADIMIVIDGSDSNVAGQLQSYAARIIAARSVAVLDGRFLAMKALVGRVASVDTKVRVWYNPDLKSVNYMVPALVGLILTLTTMILTSAIIVKEKERGTLEQLIVTPLRRWELILGKVAPFVAIGFLEVALITLAGIAWFQVPFRGSIFLLFGLCTVFLFATVGQGILISTLSKTQHQAQTTSWFFMLPSMLLSGFVFPIANMPRVIQLLTYVIPLRYFLAIVRGIFLKGVGFDVLWRDFLTLTFLGIVIFGASVLRFRKKLA